MRNFLSQPSSACHYQCWAILAAVTCVFSVVSTVSAQEANQAPPSNPPNIIFVLADDHRYDAMGFLGHPFLETPAMDRMAREGIYFKNAFVTTSLCSPSRASILSGQYAHNHGVVDNYNPVDAVITFFPEYLQQAGYETAFIGKWHMGGEVDDPREGFDHWLSFKGQGTYWADGHGTSRKVPQNSNDGYNLNGRPIEQQGYITDELTDYALDWLKNRTADQPYMLYLSHKAVHSDFVAADRHIGTYRDQQMPVPITLANTTENYANKPMWLRNQRNSRHGVDFAYNLPDFDLNAYYQRYCETLLAVDENLGRIIDWLESRDELRSTVLIYMGDNGFQFGEHGLIDKRTAYEASIRVPLLMLWPDQVKEAITVEAMVANIDIAPTLLNLAGGDIPKHMDGQSFLPLMKGDSVDGQDELLYEYYWERNYPYTPTTTALRTNQYKFIRYHGVWDLDEFFDLAKDPHETRNLINDPQYQSMVEAYRLALFEKLQETNGNTMPLLPDRGNQYPLRHPQKSNPAPFPASFMYR